MNSKHFITYKSSAGSGKTYTLVKTYLSLLFRSESDFKFKEILAITFTNKAANEMKERVFSALKHLGSKTLQEDDSLLVDYKSETGLSKTELQLKSNKLLSIFLHHYSDISIMTIDSFAHRLIRSFSRELNLESDFEIELDQSAMISESVDNLMLQVGKDEILSKAILEFSNGLALQDKKWTPENSITELVHLAGRENNDIKIPSISLIEIINKQKQLTKELRSIQLTIKENAQTVIVIANELGDHNIAGQKSGWATFFKKILADVTNVDLKLKGMPNAINNDKWLSANHSSNADSVLLQNKQIIIDSYNRIIKNQIRVKEINTLLSNLIALGLLNEIGKLLDVYKGENNLALLSEFNERISEIVASEATPFIFEKIGVKYGHYFIDEFQDTSVLQWQNFIPLIDEGLSQGKDSLLVGDAKQAIYRWRNGEAKQFIELPKIYKKKESELYNIYETNFGHHHQDKQLDTNYRSTSTIVDFNNVLFSKLAPLLSPDNQKVYTDVFQKQSSSDIGYVEVEFANSKQENFTRERLLRSISDAVSDGYSYGDIAILVRAHSPAKVYGEILLENNIPFVSAQSLSVLDNPIIKSIVALLKCASNLNNDLDILTILQELFTDSISKQAKAIELKNNSINSLDQLKFSLKNKFNIVFSEVIGASLYEMANYFAHKIARNKIDRYTESFLQLLHNFVTKKGEDLGQFLDWIFAKEPKLKLNNDGQSIQLMTIHKSKGLEFPVVIIPDCNWSVVNNKSRLWIDINDHNQDKWSVPVPASSTLFTALNRTERFEKHKETELLDLLNLLYVATTRAVNKLHIFSDKPNKNTLSSLINECGLLNDEINTWGTRNKRKSQHKLSKPKLFSYQTNTVETNLKISTKASEIWNLDDLENEKIHGDFIHNILDNSNSLEHCFKKIERYVLLGKMSINEAEEFKIECRNLFKIPSIRDLLVLPSISEREMLLPEGDIYRPDRVIETKNETILIDFKGGFPQENHKKQLANYENILLEMGYSNVKKYLLYTRNQQLVSAE